MTTEADDQWQPAGGNIGPNDSDVPELAPIGVVQAITGLSARQIRYYEQQQLVSSQRTVGNQRLYTRNQIERIQEIQELVASGFKLNAIRALWDVQGKTQKVSAPVAAPHHPRHGRIGEVRWQEQIRSLYPLRRREDPMRPTDK